MKNFFNDWWRSYFNEYEKTAMQTRFTHSFEAAEARVQVLLEPAIEACLDEARGLVEPDEPQIPRKQVRKAFLKHCGEAFDRYTISRERK